MRQKMFIPKMLRPAAWTALLGICTLAGAALFVQTGHAANDEAEGLRGILAVESPEGLLADDLSSALPPKWQDWASATAASVEQLYTGDLDAAGQRAQVDDIRGRIGTIDTCLGDPRYRAIRTPLLTIRGRLARRVAIAEAILDTLEAQPSADASTTQPVAVDALRDKLGELASAIDDYEAENSAAAAAAIRGIVSELEGLAPDGGKRIWSAVLVHYLNYNLRITAGEGLFRSILSEARVDNRPVRDHFMGTNIVGNSTVTSNVDFDLKNNPNAAEFNILANGHIQSRTTGYNPKATLFTRGNHHFLATKPVRFDGTTFTAGQASISVNARNHTYAARTKYTKTLIGKLADRYAVKEAAKRRPQSEAHARRRVRERVLPEFNSEIDAKLARNNAEIAEELNPRLKAKGLYPEAYNYRTTDTTFIANYRVAGPTELSGGAPISIPTPNDGAVVRVHEGYVNNLLDRLELAGKVMTETELRAHLQAFFSELSGQEIAIDPPEEEDGNQFVFADEDPIRVQFEDGQLIVRLVTGLRRPGEDDIPQLPVTIPLAYSVRDGQIVVERGTVKVSIKGGLGVAAVLRKRLQASIPEERVREGLLEIEKDDGTMLPLQITGLDMLDGWLALVIEK